MTRCIPDGIRQTDRRPDLAARKVQSNGNGTRMTRSGASRIRFAVEPQCITVLVLERPETSPEESSSLAAAARSQKLLGTACSASVSESMLTVRLAVAQEASYGLNDIFSGSARRRHEPRPRITVRIQQRHHWRHGLRQARDRVALTQAKPPRLPIDSPPARAESVARAARGCRTR